MRRPTVLGMTLLAVTLLATPARAEVSDELAEELKGYVDQCIEQGDTVAKRAALLTWGYIADDDEQREAMAEYKSADEAAVRLAAGLAHWRAGGEEAKSFVVEQLNERASLFPALQNEVWVIEDERERELLKQVIEEGEPPQQKAVFRYLSRQKGPLYALLGEYVASSDSSLRGFAVDAVRGTARKRALDFVESKMLASSDEAVQVRGVELASYLSEFPGRVTRAKEVLKGALEHDNAAVVEKAGIALLDLHDDSGVDKLVELMADADELKRKKKIARAMLERDASPPGERVTSLYKEAQLALKRKEKSDKEGSSPPGASAGPVDAELAQLYLQLSAAAGEDEAFKKIKHMFGTTRFEKRLNAAEALGYVDKSEAAEMLGKALFEGSEEMRLAAARSLRQNGSEEAIPSLKRAIQQERNDEVKVQIIRALGAIGSEKALRILRFNSKTRKPAIREAVIAAVRDAGAKRGFQTLQLYLSGRDLEIQWKAFLAALEIAPDKAMGKVDDIFRNPADNFMQDLRAVSSERQKLLLPELLTHDTRRVRTEAFRGARQIGPPLYDVFRDIAFDSDAPDDIRRKCLRLLSTIRATEDRSRFEKLVRNSDSLEFKKLGLWTLAAYGSKSLEATFRGFVTSDSPLIKALGAYGLVRVAASSDA